MENPKQIINRIFAVFFAVLILLFMYYLVTEGMAVPVIDMINNFIGSRLLAIILFYSTITLGFSLILVGLFIEVFKPSFDFNLNKNRIWFIASIVLFIVFILINAEWWVFYGITDFLPQGLWITLYVWVFGVLAMETSSLSLLFGTLFLTKTQPQKSISYKIILIGALLFELSIFGLYLQSAFGGYIRENISGGLEGYLDFWNYTIFQPWFWIDLASEITILSGAIWLLWKSKLKSTTYILLIVAGLVYLFIPLIFIPIS
ncbi:hypothetical protein FJZ53_02970 [Candidatus Woesearchaeota archaeon]|nr:hypothetical protein [Candidatus Woesearchaeota archaeon]